MFAVHRCCSCSASLRRSECRVEPDGLFGPELLCPHCGGLVQARVTILGWALAIIVAILLGAAVYWLQFNV
jgi:hypothetical protein